MKKINEYINCPLCNEKIDYKKIGDTHIWICNHCPFIGFEFYDDSNIKDISKYLNK